MNHINPSIIWHDYFHLTYNIIPFKPNKISVFLSVENEYFFKKTHTLCGPNCLVKSKREN